MYVFIPSCGGYIALLQYTLLHGIKIKHKQSKMDYDKIKIWKKLKGIFQ